MLTSSLDPHLRCDTDWTPRCMDRGERKKKKEKKRRGIEGGFGGGVGWGVPPNRQARVLGWQQRVELILAPLADTRTTPAH